MAHHLSVGGDWRQGVVDCLINAYLIIGSLGHIWHTISAWEETGDKVWLIADLDDHCICHIGSLS